MKKYFFLSLLLMQGLAFSGQAQIAKGSKMVGGTGFGEIRSEGFHGALHPNLGFFLTDHLALGTGIVFSYGRYSSSRTASGHLSPFFRYYVGKSATRVFAMGDIGLGRYSYYRKPDDWYPEVRETSSSIIPRLGLGLTHLLTEQVGLEVVVRYQWPKYYNSQIVSENSIYLSLGFQVYLPGKRNRDKGAGQSTEK